jgi:CRISPR/Cas system CSM-associated protein Csm3 (group 7 of RAMP superfamily)
MARKINARLRLQGTLHVVSALHVGDAGEGGRDVDLALAENGQGQPYVPGTSLAGAFRDWHAQAGTADELWGQGPMERGARAPDGDGWASRVHVEDANVHLPDGLHLSEVRDGVGIDRRTGAAAKGVKYDRRVLPAGTKIDLLMTVEVDDKHREAAERLLVSLRRGLEQGEIRLGAARSRGLGKVTLSGGGVTVEDLGSRDGVVAALLRLREDPAAPAQEPVAEPVEERSAASEPSAIRIEIEWRPIGPLMVKASAEGLGIDSLPLTIATEGGRAPLLPGSSIKGAIRAHAERIVRTVLERPIPAGEPFQEQVSPDELIDWVFGYAPRGQRAELPKERGIAALWISDCRARTSVPVTAWEKVEEAGWISHADWADHNKDEVAAGKGPGTQTARGALEAIPQIAAWDPAVHVALDRWTKRQRDPLPRDESRDESSVLITKSA